MLQCAGALKLLNHCKKKLSTVFSKLQLSTLPG